MSYWDGTLAHLCPLSHLQVYIQSYNFVYKTVRSSEFWMMTYSVHFSKVIHEIFTSSFFIIEVFYFNIQILNYYILAYHIIINTILIIVHTM